MDHLRLASLAWVAAALGALSACGPSGRPPELGAVADQVVAVNREVVVLITARDPDGDALRYGFSGGPAGLSARASMGQLPNGAAEFRWTPLAADLGAWPVDFTVSDGDHEVTATVTIDVRSAIGDGTAPVFVHPLGNGTALDLEVSECLELDVEVTDADSTDLELRLGAPEVEGAELTQTGATSGQLRFCPDAAQIAADDRYPLTLVADDHDNPPTEQPYLVVLFNRSVKPDCPGAAPTIDHVPEDVTSLVGLTIAADVSDDLGLKREPLLYWTTATPSDPPDLSTMTQAPMLLIDGDLNHGTWAADVPNPAVGLDPGAQRTLHYVIVAADDDDPLAGCDHVTLAPTTGAFSTTVTNPGGEGGGAMCTACTHDAQCGGPADHCVSQGTAGAAYCLAGCAAGCPSGSACTASPLVSVNGATAPQCVPDGGECGAQVCFDDSREDNDGKVEAEAKPPLTVGSHALTSCPAAVGTNDDEDWFAIDLAGDTTVTVELSGGDASDLDLAIAAPDGGTLAISLGNLSQETLTRCLPAGRYFVRVFAWNAVENDYTLRYSRTAGACAP
jgi:hypothetical protein